MKEKKKKRTVKSILASRMVIVIPALALQIFWIVVLVRWLSPYSAVIGTILSALATLFVLYLTSKRDEPSYKILWLIVILSAPVLGALLYIFFGNKKTGRPLKRQLAAASKRMGGPPKQDDGIIETVEADDLRMSQTMRYTVKMSGFPVYENASAKYYKCGEDLFFDYIDELKKAERYIYIEYFIIESGFMWDSILEILTEKAKNGVDVRVIYDDLGSFGTLPSRYNLELINEGIKCIKFNPFIISVTGRLNNRDHRKITVIDGRVAFSGGINLADEYINKVQRFGYWKDIGYKITGPAVSSFTYMFAEFWNGFSLESVPQKFVEERNPVPAVPDGYILPYYDSPANSYHTSEVLFSEILAKSEKYAWFYTPYLMMGDELNNAFIRAAERGVDVRIIMPGIPDKKVIFRISRSYYRPLIEAGVRIYEYTPGFVHAKACLSDDVTGTVGSVNLDYRSLYLHFECNSLFYKASILNDLKADLEESMSKSKKISLEDTKGNALHEMVNVILRLFAPLC